MVAVFYVDFDMICTRRGIWLFHAHGKRSWPLPSNRSIREGEEHVMVWLLWSERGLRGCMRRGHGGDVLRRFLHDLITRKDGVMASPRTREKVDQLN